MAARPLITLLTDFGLSDHYVGAMKGVLLGICPDASLVDISHEVTPYTITEAAYTLAQAWQCFPQGTVHLVVVDPGVGSQRRPMIAQVDGHSFVCPDNGVLSMVYDSARSIEVREITASAWYRQPVSRTFHGRDVFSPIAAHRARGTTLSRFGPVLSDFVRLGISKPVEESPQRWRGIIFKVDHFGNVVTNFPSLMYSDNPAARLELRTSGETVNRYCTNYAAAEPGALFITAGSSGYLEISLREASAAAALGCHPGDEAHLSIS